MSSHKSQVTSHEESLQTLDFSRQEPLDCRCGAPFPPATSTVNCQPSTVNRPPLRLAILVSGGGTTLQAIIDAIDSGYLNARISLVISSRREVKAPERARKHGIPVEIIRPRDFEDAASYDCALAAALEHARPDLLVLAGYLSIIGERTLAAYSGRIMNIHPSLLPSFGGKGFYGRYVHEKVLEYGCKVTGCTVMFVDNQVDTGPIILQEAVPVFEDDTVDSLATRVSEVEKRLYPEAIKLFAEGRLTVNGRRVRVEW